MRFSFLPEFVHRQGKAVIKCYDCVTAPASVFRTQWIQKKFIK